MGKTITVTKAVEAIPEGSTLMIGGFMGVGSPIRLIDELVRQRKLGLTIIANDTARPGVAIGRLIGANLVRASHNKSHWHEHGDAAPNACGGD
jgi:acetate CoA/acetoacetate CoA-transferase alpha subunit